MGHLTGHLLWVCCWERYSPLSTASYKQASTGTPKFDPVTSSQRPPHGLADRAGGDAVGVSNGSLSARRH